VKIGTVFESIRQISGHSYSSCTKTQDSVDLGIHQVNISSISGPDLLWNK
jgi:hypothetical protein